MGRSTLGVHARYQTASNEDQTEQNNDFLLHLYIPGQKARIVRIVWLRNLSAAKPT